MKTKLLILGIILLGTSKLFADDKADSTYIAGWTFGVSGYINLGYSQVLQSTENKQAFADRIDNFDPLTSDFDATWNGSKYAAYAVENNVSNTGNHTGASDFSQAGFKAFYDDDNLYILVQFVDDNITGNESIEIPWATYFELYGKNPMSTDGSGNPKEYTTARYLRYSAFGAYKATFNKNGFVNAMKIDFASPTAQGVLNWGGTNENLANNLSVKDKTVTGSGVVKWIITLGFPVFTSAPDAFTNETFPLPRPDFNVDIFKALNGKKGLSFDLKINDNDGTADTNPASKPAEYWWNTINNDCYSHTWYAGFLGIEDNTAVKNTAEKNIITKLTRTNIELVEPMNVVIYDITGKVVFSEKSVSHINVSSFNKGLYVINAGGFTSKFELK